MIGHPVARPNQDTQPPTLNPVDLAWVGGHLAVPLVDTQASRGILSETDAITSNQSHAALLKLGPVDPRMLLVQVPVIQMISQMAVNARSRQTRRLSSAMVNPRLAWSPQ